MIPVKVEQLADAVRGTLLVGNAKQMIKNIMIDSREKEEDSLFVPIIGEKTDGHKYAAGAVSGGAKALLMQKESMYKEEILAVANEHAVSVVAVEDTVAALQRFAAWYRNRFTLPVVGITGSVGRNRISGNNRI